MLPSWKMERWQQKLIRATENYKEENTYNMNSLFLKIYNTDTGGNTFGASPFGIYRKSLIYCYKNKIENASNDSKIYCFFLFLYGLKFAPPD